MCCILTDRKFYPLSESGIRFSIAFIVFVLRCHLSTALFDPQITICGTLCLGIKAKIKYTLQILEEPIQADLQSNFQRNWSIFGDFIVILVVKNSVFIKKSPNDVTMTSFLAKTAHDIKILTKTLQNHIVKEAFAKKCMSKALSVQKKIADRQTDLSINYMQIDRLL